MERLIAAGVDGLITDYPDRLRAVHGGEEAAAAAGCVCPLGAEQTAIDRGPRSSLFCSAGGRKDQAMAKERPTTSISTATRRISSR